MKFKFNYGFSLIEILVVIAIIGIIMAIASTAYQSTRKSARDAKRKSDLQMIVDALERYKRDKGYYPYEKNCDMTPDAQGKYDDCFGSDGSDRPEWSNNKSCAESGALANHILCVLVDGGYLERLPIDPGKNSVDWSNPNLCGRAQIYIYEVTRPQGSGYRLSAVEEAKGANDCLEDPVNFRYNCKIDWLGSYQYCLQQPGFSGYHPRTGSGDD